MGRKKAQPGDSLTPKQERFAREYVIDGKGAAAARRAGYSPNGASANATRLLSSPHVRGRVDVLLARQAKKLDLTAERVKEELARVAFGDLRSVVSWGPGRVTLKNSSGLTDDQAAAVSEVMIEDSKFGRNTKIKLHDKVRALDLLAKQFGMYQTGPETLNQINIQVNVVSPSS